MKMSYTSLSAGLTSTSSLTVAITTTSEGAAVSFKLSDCPTATTVLFQGYNVSSTSVCGESYQKCSASSVTTPEGISLILLPLGQAVGLLTLTSDSGFQLHVIDISYNCEFSAFYIRQGNEVLGACIDTGNSNLYEIELQIDSVNLSSSNVVESTFLCSVVNPSRVLFSSLFFPGGLLFVDLFNQSRGLQQIYLDDREYSGCSAFLEVFACSEVQRFVGFSVDSLFWVVYCTNVTYLTSLYGDRSELIFHADNGYPIFCSSEIHCIFLNSQLSLQFANGSAVLPPVNFPYDGVLTQGDCSIVSEQYVVVLHLANSSVLAVNLNHSVTTLLGVSVTPPLVFGENVLLSNSTHTRVRNLLDVEFEDTLEQDLVLGLVVTGPEVPVECFTATPAPSPISPLALSLAVVTVVVMLVVMTIIVIVYILVACYKKRSVHSSIVHSSIVHCRSIHSSIVHCRSDTAGYHPVRDLSMNMDVVRSTDRWSSDCTENTATICSASEPVSAGGINTPELKLDYNNPGIIFSKMSVTEHIHSSGADINCLEDMGIAVSIPEGFISTEDSLDLTIRPCFSGPFKLPEEYESASPAYLIHHSKVKFHRDITVRIQHHVCLQSEEDCEDMVFLSASSVPSSNQEYTFKEVADSSVKFMAGSQVGQVELGHFCLLKSGKRKRQGKSSTSKKHKMDTDNNLYSVRLYRNLLQTGPVSAVFCISLLQPVYIKHCDEVISSEYTGMTEKGEGRTVVTAKITEDEVGISSECTTGYNVTFDKIPPLILKSDIHMPKWLKPQTDVTELTDYPPRVSITVRQTTPSLSPPRIQVSGLNREWSFELPVYSTEIQSASEERSKNIGAPTRQSITEPASSKDLDISSVCIHLYPFRAKWRIIGTFLKIEHSCLDAIEADKRTSDDRLTELVAVWLRRDTPPPTWQALEEVVQLIKSGNSVTSS